jgi:hypothetical protein
MKHFVGQQIELFLQSHPRLAGRHDGFSNNRTEMLTDFSPRKTVPNLHGFDT